ncbi:MAG: SynChlorMet cassette radical SAM/SPASM protein ScmF [Deltaproteobacteria bacterium]|nr:SynChlorMet cassette radical SAM/SPASM protein ScmF [Deltaproteobacteria bacterium]
MDRDDLDRVREHPYPLNRIYFYLIEGCNLRCQHCWIPPGHQAEDRSSAFLEPDLFRSILHQAKPLGLAGVKLTGGEPLLHPRIREILKQVRDEGLDLGIETNGTLCTPELAGTIAEGRTPFVSVSLDGADARTHEWVRGVPGCFEAALEGIRNLVRVGIRPQVILTVMRRNRDQLERVVRLAESLGAGSVKFNILQPTARGERLHEVGEALDMEELITLGQWVEGDLSAGTDLPLHHGHPPAFRPLGKILPENGDGCAVCGILGILGVLADGSYALCGIGQSIPELVFGHAAKDPLEVVWNRSSVLGEIRRGLPRRFEGICSRCVMMSRCLGMCLAQNYYSSRRFWAPYWYCERANNLGLFPRTRIRPG